MHFVSPGPGLTTDWSLATATALEAPTRMKRVSCSGSHGNEHTVQTCWTPVLTHTAKRDLQPSVFWKALHDTDSSCQSIMFTTLT